MGRYALKRLMIGIICLIGVSMIVFVLIRLTGDVTEILLPQDATQADHDQLRAELGLDKPIPVQYLIFVEKVLRGDFGKSTRWTRPALELVLDRIPATLELATSALFFATVVGLIFGVVSATKRGSIFDTISRIVVLVGQSAPSFWVGLMLILWVSVKFGLLPSSGRGGLSHLILPAFTLSLYPLASIARLTRSSLLNVLDGEYIKMARLKGNPESIVIWKHGMKNAAIPVVTLLGLLVGHVIGRSVIVESVFTWPGLGKLIIEAVYARDYAVVQGGVCLIAIVYISVNLAVDLVYGLLDPRIRYE